MNCSGNKQRIWDGESRITWNMANSTDRQDAAVILEVPSYDDPAYVAECSGTMIESNWALTAGHCLIDGSIVPWLPTFIKACNRGNKDGTGADCVTATVNTPNPDVVFNDLDDDWGVVKLPGLGSGGRTIPMSSVGEATHTQHTQRTLGYPGDSPSTCNPNEPARENTGVSASGQGYRQNEDWTYFTTSRIGTRLDSGPGQSGSPIFYVPTSGGQAFITGVLAGSWCCARKTGGPKVAVFRSWVHANTP